MCSGSATKDSKLQKLKAERGISFVEARRIVTAENNSQPTQPNRTAAAVVSSRCNSTCPATVTCQCPLTVKHILIECTDFRDIRNKYFVPSTMKDVFKQVNMLDVINFIKETHFTIYSNVCYPTLTYILL